MIKVKIFLINILILAISANTLFAACDFTTTENVIITPSGNHNSNSTYTQVYLLTDENGNIVSMSNNGDFGTQNFGEYNAYALNYETANAPSTLPGIGVNILSINDGCALFSAPLPITVCETSVLYACENSGDEIIIALNPDYNDDNNYEQVVVIVDDNTNEVFIISSPNLSTGTTNYSVVSGTGDLPVGNYSAYAVNYENSETLISLGLIAGNQWSGNFGNACAAFFGPAIIQVDDCNPCISDAGITSAVTSDPANIDYVLCWNETITLSTSNFVLSGITPSEGYGYAVYSSPMPGTVPNPMDLNFIEIIVGTGSNANLTLANNGSYTPPFINNPDQTIYIYPVTLDDISIPAIDQNNDGCYDVGNMITITFLNDIFISSTEDCLNESAVYEIDGGYLEYFSGVYSITNNGDGFLTNNSVILAGGLTSVGNLLPGDEHFISVIDNNGCQSNTLPQLYPVNLQFDSIILDNPTCDYLCNGGVTVYSSNASQYALDNSNYQTSNIFSNICAGSLTITIEDNSCYVDSVITLINPSPLNITISNDTTICANGTATLTAFSSGGTGTLQNYWNQTPSGSTISVSPQSNTTYNAFAIDDSGCSTDTLNVEVMLYDPITLTTNPSSSICEGDSFTLTASATGGDGTYQYSWSNNQGTGWFASGSSVIINPDQNTQYFVEVNDGCSTPSSFESINITVNTIPIVSFEGDETEGCYPLTVNFSNTTSASSSCNWEINGETFSDCDFSYTFEDVGCYDVTLSATSNEGCLGTATLMDYICTYDYPEAYFEASDTVISIFNPLVSFQNLSTDNYTNYWNFGNLSSDNSIDPSFLFPQLDTSYSVCLLVENQFGCTDEFCLEITIQDEMTMYVPNTFTPNDDGDNDYFFPIFNDNLISNFDMTIYNRWGELIFKSTSAFTKWDGTFQGEECQQDTYIWKIEYQQENSYQYYVSKGHVNLLR